MVDGGWWIEKIADADVRAFSLSTINQPPSTKPGIRDRICTD
jgi:hypothetical protein